MKKLLFLAVLIAASFSMNAQNCCAKKANKSAETETAASNVASMVLTKKQCTPEEIKECAKTCTPEQMKACLAGKTAATGEESKGETRVASMRLEADDLAAKDENIERRQCAETGAVGYFMKYKCSVTNEMTSAEVEYDANTKQFVKLASEVEKEKNCAKTCKSKAKS